MADGCCSSFTSNPRILSASSRDGVVESERRCASGVEKWGKQRPARQSSQPTEMEWETGEYNCGNLFCYKWKRSVYTIWSSTSKYNACNPYTNPKPSAPSLMAVNNCCRSMSYDEYCGKSIWLKPNRFQCQQSSFEITERYDRRTCMSGGKSIRCTISPMN